MLPRSFTQWSARTRFPCRQSGLGVNRIRVTWKSYRIIPGTGVPCSRRLQVLKHLEYATFRSLAADGIESLHKRFAINNGYNRGTEWRTAGGNEQAVPQPPASPADDARAVIADVFNPRAFRIARVADNFQLAETPDGCPLFQACAAHRMINLLMSRIHPEISPRPAGIPTQKTKFQMTF